MDELEIEDGVVEAFEGAAEDGASVENEAAEVEDNAGVNEVANAPDIEGQSNLQAVRDFISNNPYGKVMWGFAKMVGSASIAFGVMYGLNKALAKNAADSGKRTALSVYIAGVQANLEKMGQTWTDDLKTTAVTDALAFPWIDASQ
jgi:hypothetical protein